MVAIRGLIADRDRPKLPGRNAMKKESLNPALIRAVYSSYRNQRRILNDLNKKMSTASSEDEWISVFKERSDTLKVAYDVNTETGALISNVLFSDNKLTYDYAEAFFHEDCKNASDSERDVFVSCRTLEKLAGFYRDRHDLLRLIPVLTDLGKMYSATIKMYYDENYVKALNCFKEILDYKGNYNIIPEISVRKLFFEAYYSLCCVLPIMETKYTITASEALDYLLEVLSFYNSPFVQKIDGGNDDIRLSVELIKQNWLWIEYRIDTADPETKSAFIKVAHSVYGDSIKAFDNDITKIPVSTILSYQHALILEGSTSYIDAVNYMMDFYHKKRAVEKPLSADTNLNLDDFYFETKIPIAMIKWLDKIDILSEMCDSMRKKLMDELNSYYISLSEHGIFSHLIYESVCEWCFFAINYLSGAKEKEDFITEMLINRQPLTFFDAYLSADLAALITESLYLHQPILLNSVENCLKSYKRPAGRLDVIRFIKKCALYHDVGLNRLCSIQGIQYRALDETEHYILKKHTELGARLFTGELAIYREPVLGHHKYYDQTDGYPENVDMSNSPLRIVCDILAICDSLNAGTDSIGRCYKEPKDFSIVLSELITFSGTRYNTNLVNLFLDDMELSCKVDSLISNNRLKTYYDYHVRYYEKISNIKHQEDHYEFHS